MNTEMKSAATKLRTVADPRHQDGAPDQRPGVERVDRLLEEVGRHEDRLDLVVDVAAGAEPGKAVVLERRPRLAEHEHDHRGDEQHDGADQRAEQELGALARSQP